MMARSFGYDAMRILARETYRSIALQIERIREQSRRFDAGETDLDALQIEEGFLRIAVWKLDDVARCVLDYAAISPEAESSLKSGRHEFRAYIPDMKILRDSYVHEADYAAGRGREQGLSVGRMRAGVLQPGEVTFPIRIDGEDRAIKLGDLDRLSTSLYEAIRAALVDRP